MERGTVGRETSSSFPAEVAEGEMTRSVPIDLDDKHENRHASGTVMLPNRLDWQQLRTAEEVKSGTAAHEAIWAAAMLPKRAGPDSGAAGNTPVTAIPVSIRYDWVYLGAATM